MTMCVTPGPVTFSVLLLCKNDNDLQLFCSADLLVMVGDNAWQYFCVQLEKHKKKKEGIYILKKKHVGFLQFVLCVIVALMLLHAFVVADAALPWCCPEPANWK